MKIKIKGSKVSNTIEYTKVNLILPWSERRFPQEIGGHEDEGIIGNKVYFKKDGFGVYVNLKGIIIPSYISDMPSLKNKVILPVKEHIIRDLDELLKDQTLTKKIKSYFKKNEINDFIEYEKIHDGKSLKFHVHNFNTREDLFDTIYLTIHQINSVSFHVFENEGSKKINDAISSFRNIKSINGNLYTEGINLVQAIAKALKVYDGYCDKVMKELYIHQGISFFIDEIIKK